MDYRTVWYGDTLRKHKYCVVMLEHPKVFHPIVQQATLTDPVEVEVDINDDVTLIGTFSVGWENFPTWQYFPEENRFDPIDPHELEQMKAWWRRERLIGPDISRDVPVATELKNMRKVLKDLIAIIPEAQKLESVQRFQELSNFIESKIAEYVKGADEEVDILFENGVEPTRMKSLRHLGVDSIPPKKELFEPVVDPEQDRKSRVIAGNVNQKRLRLEKAIRDRRTLKAKELKDVL